MESVATSTVLHNTWLKKFHFRLNKRYVERTMEQTIVRCVFIYFRSFQHGMYTVRVLINTTHTVRAHNICNYSTPIWNVHNRTDQRPYIIRAHMSHIFLTWSRLLLRSSLILLWETADLSLGTMDMVIIIASIFTYKRTINCVNCGRGYGDWIEGNGDETQMQSAHYNALSFIGTTAWIPWCTWC